jgi:hypothetical protein
MEDGMDSSLVNETPPVHAHSTTVELRIHVNGVSYELWDVGPEDATLKVADVRVPVSDDAVLEVIVDGRSRRERVRVLPSEVERRIRYARV